MVRQLEAIYENGVLRPLEPLQLEESQRVMIFLSDQTAPHPLRDEDAHAQARAEVAQLDHIPTIEEVRAALSVIPGSMSEFVIQERGEY